MIVCVLAYLVLEIFSLIARRYFITSNDTPDDLDNDDDTSDVDQQPSSHTNSIAKPQNTHNPPLVCCEHVKQLAQHTGDDPAIITAVMIALARIIVKARRADGSAKLGETDAIRYGLNITPGGANPIYRIARAALQAEIARQRGSSSSLDPIDLITRDGKVVRRSPDGQQYIDTP